MESIAPPALPKKAVTSLLTINVLVPADPP